MLVETKINKDCLVNQVSILIKQDSSMVKNTFGIVGSGKVHFLMLVTFSLQDLFK